ncbi:CHAT domain-containing protein [Streptomyces mirabilis]|uniref:CHAT domain-containing protein n=1 Tax=Streptomyces mirabilis TaxID=68239 RepID=UPI00332B071A
MLNELGYDGVPAVEDGDCDEGWPRVWWAPGGPLGLLPLHAAGYHTDSADDPHRRTVMDRIVSSYTPTVRSLRYARERTLSPAAVRSLIVAMPTTPGLPNHGRLRFVEAVHLTSAFQLTGFPHVIGTLWEVDDQIAVTIADLFYAALQTDFGLDPARAAHALHKAVRRVRDGHGLPAPFDRRRAPLLWAAYLHAGA